MKVIRGSAGYPDGWIPPEDVLDLTAADVDKMLNSHYHGKDGVQLFNLTADPEERKDLAKMLPEMTAKMLQRLSEFDEEAVPPDNAKEVKKRPMVIYPVLITSTFQVIEGNPWNFGGFYSPGWCQSQPSNRDPLVTISLL